MSYKSVLHDVKKARDNRLSGNLNTIPFLNLPRFSNVVTGIEKAYYTNITAKL